MDLVMHFANVISPNCCNPAAVNDMALKQNGKLIRCYINPWNGVVTVIEHCKNSEGTYDEIGSIIVDDNDNIIIEIL